MSRGHGSVQRLVLDHIGRDWLPVRTLAERLSGGKPSTRAWEEPVRRACKRLADERLVELGYDLEYDVKHYPCSLLIEPPPLDRLDSFDMHDHTYRLRRGGWWVYAEPIRAVLSDPTGAPNRRLAVRRRRRSTRR